MSKTSLVNDFPFDEEIQEITDNPVEQEKEEKFNIHFSLGKRTFAVAFEDSYILLVEKKTTEESGKERVITMGYYTRIEHLVRALLMLNLSCKKDEINDLKEIKNSILEIERIVADFFKGESNECK